MGKQHSNKFRGVILLISLILFGGALFYANNGFQDTGREHLFIDETAKVVQILEDNKRFDEDGNVQGNMQLELEILTGRFQGERVESPHFFHAFTTDYIEIGNRFSVQISLDNGEIGNVQIQNPERREILVGFFIVFLIILGFVGGKRGLMAIAGLIFTMVSIIFLLIPLMLKGHPVILTTLIILSLVTVVTLILLGGITPKTISAILGCIIGVVTAAVLAHVVGNLTYISGLNMEEVPIIVARSEFPAAEASGLFISGVLIASLGAVMDTAVSVSSAMEEIKASNPKMSPGKLFRSGMNVGRDTMGTMSNTLILAFTGTSLNMMILIYSQEIGFNHIINSDLIAIELIRSLAGSLGIIFTVPAVAFIAAMMMGADKTKGRRNT